MDKMQFDYISIYAYKLPHKLGQKSYGNIEKAFNKARKKSQSTGIHADACDFSGRLHSFAFIVGLGTFARIPPERLRVFSKLPPKRHGQGIDLFIIQIS
ncbi:hypothetical protein [Paenibacillus harenae]|uniref:Uncharacterized protein n=1 Tax=Paenibacillus harenae TaxID=306543 RepID=A0ABT9UA28_PAEHA|nr:hypothetical protein [Paenibacillus harenae]MDQ0116491.1 hypothetical protein [Paenibacillus harenae]